MKFLNRRTEPEPDPRFNREFFDGIERKITQPVPQVGPPREKNILQKAQAYDDMENRCHQIFREFVELAKTKHALLDEINADLAADKRKTEERLNHIARLTAHYGKNGSADVDPPAEPITEVAAEKPWPEGGNAQS